MAKIYPNLESTTSSQSHDDQWVSNKRERYTLWMKSLVLHSNGCTVYDSKGNIVYRVDNYDTKGGREINLMNLQGNVLCIIKKRLLAFGCWEGHRYYSNSNSRSHEDQPWFQVNRCLTGKIACQIKAGSQNLCIERMSNGKAFGFQIVNKDGEMIAEAKQKLSSSGVVLSNDVLTLDLESGTDHCLIMALITAYGLMCGKM
ncbi:protein LURP-one-related 11-like [Vicia villosa]|uniref:protein LURP-one-related 11-like n=1 Tax=Vicia villosa TaxID=3911 RepID=UPI00273BD771|nr:protein LURP-one-related 11-like [Vicia villosa]